MKEDHPIIQSGIQTMKNKSKIENFIVLWQNAQRLKKTSCWELNMQKQKKILYKGLISSNPRVHKLCLLGWLISRLHILCGFYLDRLISFGPWIVRGFNLERWHSTGHASRDDELWEMVWVLTNLHVEYTQVHPIRGQAGEVKVWIKYPNDVPTIAVVT